MATNKRRLAVIGTGHRGTGTWSIKAPQTCADEIELVAMCDTNAARLSAAAARVGADTPTFTDLDQMIAIARPHTILVSTRDDTHADIIIKALEAGIDVITEKPMATTARDCRRIIDAENRTGRRVDVAFNYRFAPTSLKIKELLTGGRIGTITSCDFHWYLDTRHGADYFRRWHAYRRYSGTLFVHKATHHFDLLNWWLDSDPKSIFAKGQLRNYGHNGRIRGLRCTGCEHSDTCDFYFDMAKSDGMAELYEGPSAVDGYIRDACVFRDDIDIYDTMTACLSYENSVEVSYSLNTFMPIEGFHLAFNGTKGRIEIRMYERQAFEAETGTDEILVLGTDRSVERIRVEHGPGGHFGGDPLLHKALFVPDAGDPTGQRAGSRAGALSVITGVAATQSIDTGRPVEIAPLFEGSADG